MFTHERGVFVYIAICDDEKDILDSFVSLLENWLEIHPNALRYKTFSNASDLLDAAEKEHFSLYFLDIMMSGLDGLDAAREIRRFDEVADIVFLTTSPSFAYESYSVHALDYILKPIQSNLLFPILDKLLFKEQESLDALVLKSNTTMIRVPFSQIEYVEVNGKHIYFNMIDGTTKEVYGSLKEYAPLLLARSEFMQTHRSYIVNMLQVSEFSPSGIKTFFGGEKYLPVSRLLYAQLQKSYMQLLFEKNER